jgi:hypothetical protein
VFSFTLLTFYPQGSNLDYQNTRLSLNWDEFDSEFYKTKFSRILVPFVVRFPNSLYSFGRLQVTGMYELTGSPKHSLMMVKGKVVPVLQLSTTP